MFEYSYFDIPQKQGCPLKRLCLVGANGVVHKANFGDYQPEKTKHKDEEHKDAVHNPEAFETAKQQLEEYFLGKRQQFDAELFVIEGGTDYRQKTLKYIQHVAYGQTKSYKEIATGMQAGSPRSVGGAMRDNPLPIFVPCHRIMGHTGKLTGFSGELDMKRWLLDLENNQLN